MSVFFKNETIHDISKIIFESLRNTGACTALAIAGGIILYYPEISFFGHTYAIFLSFGLVINASFLLMLNIILTMDHILSIFKGKSYWGFSIYFIISAILIISTLSILGAQTKFAAQKLKESVKIKQVALPMQLKPHIIQCREVNTVF